MPYPVTGYKAIWNLATHKGEIWIRYNPGPPATPDVAYNTYTIYEPETPEEFALLVDLLRNETPLSYSFSPTKQLRLGTWETVGEEES